MYKKNPAKECNLDELVLSARRGDALAVGDIIAKMSSSVEIKANKFVTDELEKVDLVQEGMIGLVNAISSFDPKNGAGFNTYAQMCIDNALISAVRKMRRKKKIPSSKIVPFDDVDCPDDSHNIEDTFILKEQLKNITKSAKENLSSLEYRVFLLYIDGLSNREIAEILKIDIKAVSNALYRIRIKSANFL